MTNNPEWDGDGGEVAIMPDDTTEPILPGYGSGFSGSGFSGNISGYSGYSGIVGSSGVQGYTVPYTDTITDEDRMRNPMYIWNEGDITTASVTTATNWDVSPMIRTEISQPIIYDFRDSSWKHTFTVALNLLIGPFLCILSKLFNKKVGI